MTSSKSNRTSTIDWPSLISLWRITAKPLKCLKNMIRVCLSTPTKSRNWKLYWIKSASCNRSGAPRFRFLQRTGSHCWRSRKNLRHLGKAIKAITAWDSGSKRRTCRARGSRTKPLQNWSWSLRLIRWAYRKNKYKYCHRLHRSEAFIIRGPSEELTARETRWSKDHSLTYRSSIRKSMTRTSTLRITCFTILSTCPPRQSKPRTLLSRPPCRERSRQGWESRLLPRLASWTRHS